MPGSLSVRTPKNADRILNGPSHPVLAMVVFFASFAFAVLPFVLNTDNVFFVAPCLITCFTCSILFMRLLVGGIANARFIFLGITGYLGYVAGEQWYLVVILASGTLVGLLLVGRLIGDFTPLIRGVKF